VSTFEIAGRQIGADHPTYVIAEMSANHGQDLAEAERLIDAAADAGADAIKLQTYTPDTITIDARNKHFQIGKGTIWEGKVLHDLYGEAYTRWEWHAPLMARAKAAGLHCFSSPFDPTAVAFLEELDVPAYKIASFELVDIPLLRTVAATKKPIIVSTGMATLAEIDEAVRTIRSTSDSPIALLRTNSAYPAPPAEMDLATIPHLAESFGVVAGLSDHTLGVAVPVAAVALGARIIEKHLTMSRAVPGPDSAFSLEPDELATMIESVRTAERALGVVRYGPSSAERASLAFRRSLFAVEDIAAQAELTAENVRSIRPGGGLHTRHLDDVLGKKAAVAIEKGTPLSWDLIT